MKKSLTFTLGCLLLGSSAAQISDKQSLGETFRNYENFRAPPPPPAPTRTLQDSGSFLGSRLVDEAVRAVTNTDATEGSDKKVFVVTDEITLPDSAHTDDYPPLDAENEAEYKPPTPEEEAETRRQYEEQQKRDREAYEQAQKRRALFDDYRDRVIPAVAADYGNMPVDLHTGFPSDSPMMAVQQNPDSDNKLACTLVMNENNASATTNLFSEKAAISQEKTQYFIVAHEYEHCQFLNDVHKDRSAWAMSYNSPALQAAYANQKELSDYDAGNDPMLIRDMGSAEARVQRNEATSDVRAAIMANQKAGMTPEEIRRLGDLRRDSAKDDPEHDTSRWLYALADQLEKDPHIFDGYSQQELSTVTYKFVSANAK